MAVVVLIVACALLGGGLIGLVASRRNPVAGPIVVVMAMAVAFAILAGAASSVQPDAGVGFGLFALLVLAPLWIGELTTITWVVVRRAPVAGPAALGWIALTVGAGVLILGSVDADAHLAAAVTGLAHVAIAVALMGVSRRQRSRSAGLAPQGRRIEDRSPVP